MRLNQFSTLVFIALAALPTAVIADPDTSAPQANVSPPVDPLSAAILKRASAAAPLGTPSKDDWVAVTNYYPKHGGDALWVTKAGLTKRGLEVVSEFRRADDWGLSARAFDFPMSAKSIEGWADVELKIALAVLKYARYARGGRIVPSQIDPNLAQSPKLLDPKRVLADAVAAHDTAAYLRSLLLIDPMSEAQKDGEEIV